MPLEDCRILELLKISVPRGNLSFIEAHNHVPFEIKRVYYTYDVPGGADRGSHGHKNLQQLVIAMAGSFDVILDDRYQRKLFHLNRSYFGLCICQMIWREITNFSSGSVCLVLASECYSEADYYRDYNEFLESVRGKK